jgi:hypothetical protein
MASRRCCLLGHFITSAGGFRGFTLVFALPAGHTIFTAPRRQRFIPGGRSYDVTGSIPVAEEAVVVGHSRPAGSPSVGSEEMEAARLLSCHVAPSGVKKCVRHLPYISIQSSKAQLKLSRNLVTTELPNTQSADAYNLFSKTRARHAN